MIQPIIIGPLDTPEHMAIAIREIVDRLVEVQGLVNSVGRAAESLMPHDVVYVASSGSWHKASSNSSSTAPVTGYGINLGITPANGVARVQVAAVVDQLSGLETGRTYYLGPTGRLTLDTDGPIVVAIGVAISATTLLFQPEYIGDL